jgi:hypothetical protein
VCGQAMRLIGYGVRSFNAIGPQIRTKSEKRSARDPLAANGPYVHCRDCLQAESRFQARARRRAGLETSIRSHCSSVTPRSRSMGSPPYRLPSARSRCSTACPMPTVLRSTPSDSSMSAHRSGAAALNVATDSSSQGLAVSTTTGVRAVT